MDFHIYNTLTRQKELFVPREEGKVKIYSCWPTVYGDPHIGNLRAFATAWLLGDTLRALGYKVEHTMNITDVGHLTDDGDHGEDKMEKGSRKEWLTARDVARKYEDNFRKYIKELGIYFDYHPRATDHIQAQIDIVQLLEDKWYTYNITGDGVYMDTSKVSWYGKLLPPKHLAWIQSGERVEDVGKKNPTDFALRKFSPEGQKRQMERESPRGVWFPGRHIECSAMARATLWDFLDIHTWGIDHIPVHHTNEIAQSECGFTWGKKRVNYWVHCQFLNIDAAKISKSLGNVFSLPDIQAKWFDALDLRYFYLQAHYRSFQDFTRESLEAAQKGRKWLQKKIQDVLSSFWESEATEESRNFSKGLETMSASSLRNDLTDAFVANLLDDVLQAITDDLDTVKLLASLNHHLNAIIKNKLSINTKELLVVIHWLDSHILKIWLLDTPEKIHIPADIQSIAQARRDAKIAKDYSTADELRKELHTAGRDMLDGKDGFAVVLKS